MATVYSNSHLYTFYEAHCSVAANCVYQDVKEPQIHPGSRPLCLDPQNGKGTRMCPLECGAV